MVIYSSYTCKTHDVCVCFSNIRRYKVKVTDILKTNNCPDEFYPDGHEIPVGPFHSSDTPAPLKAKYWHIRECLDGSGFSIATIEHKPYREIYIITNLNNEKFRLDFIFNGAGLFSGPTVSPGSMVPKELISLVSVLDNFRFPFKYVPSSEPLNRLYENICSACEDSQVNMVNVVEHLESYKVVYYLKTQARFAYLEISVKKSGQVTYISPRSELGQNDDRLAEMLALIKL